MDNPLNNSEEELLIIIGRNMESDTLGMFPILPSKEEAIKNAEKWFAEKRTLLQNSICSIKGIKTIEKTKEREVVFHIICEVLTEVLTGVPAGAVAAYIVIKGTHWLCPDKNLE